MKAGVRGQQTLDRWVANANESYADPPKARDEALRSASLAAMTLIIAAQAKGFATGPMIGFDPEGVKREFGLSDRYVLVMLLTVGYATPGNWPRKLRLTVDEVLAFDRGREF